MTIVIVTVVLVTVVTVVMVTVVTVVIVIELLVLKVTIALVMVVIVKYFSKNNLTSTTDEIFSGQLFAILAMFFFEFLESLG